MFPSPYGDKLQSKIGVPITSVTGFRPLAGINCNKTQRLSFSAIRGCFRPLAGINCNECSTETTRQPKSFRPLAGINCNTRATAPSKHLLSFRPLAGINCNPNIIFEFHYPREFSSPRGDKLQLYRPVSISPRRSFSSPRGDKLQWQTLLTNHENLPQKAESCTFQQHYTSFYCKRKELFGQRGGFRWCEPVTEVRKKVCRTGWLAPHLRRRSANGVEKISHKDHLNSAEGASKP